MSCALAKGGSIQIPMMHVSNKDIMSLWILAIPFFNALALKDRGHIVLPLSVHPSVCLHKLNMKT